MAAASLTVRAYAKVNLDLRVARPAARRLPRRAHRAAVAAPARHADLHARARPVRDRVRRPGDSHRRPQPRSGAPPIVLGHVAAPRRDGARRACASGSSSASRSQAGLGGGSADAAATLLALTRLWRLKLDLVDLARLAARLGADVPFFLAGGTALGAGRGDDVSPLAEPPPTVGRRGARRRSASRPPTPTAGSISTARPRRPSGPRVPRRCHRGRPGRPSCATTWRRPSCAATRPSAGWCGP